MEMFDMPLHRPARLAGHTCPAGEAVTVHEDFAQGLSHWSCRVSAGAGVWSTVSAPDGSFLRFQRQSAGVSVTTSSNIVYTPAAFYRLRTVEAAVRFTVPVISAGLLVGWQYDGHYCVRFDGDEEQGWRVSVLKTMDHAAAFYSTLAVSEPLEGVTCGDWFTVHTDMERGPEGLCFTVRIGGHPVLRAVDPAAEQEACGEVGFRVILGELDFAALRVVGLPQRMDPPSSPELPSGIWDAVFSYENAPYPSYEGSSVPLHWMWTPQAACWKQHPDGFGTTAQEFVPIGMHAHARDVELTADLTISGLKKNGQAGLMARWFIPGGWLRAGYDAGEEAWFIEEGIGPDFSPQVRWTKGSLPTDGRVTLRLVTQEKRACLYADGELVVDMTDLQNTGHGKPGLFIRGGTLRCRRMQVRLDAPWTEDVAGYPLLEDEYSHYLETLELAPDRLLAVYQKRRFLSENGGLTFTEDTTGRFAGVNAAGGYSSLCRRADGWFVQTLGDGDLEVQQSPDGEHWRTIGHPVPPADLTDEEGDRLYCQHVGSLTEVTLPHGPRLFLPVTFRVYGGPSLFGKGRQIIGHYTRVYYSDDGGVQWTASRSDTRDVVPGYTPQSGSSWTESKVIRCADGSLRLMVTRFEQNAVCFTQSWDGGETWEGLFAFEGMPCGRASHGIAEDPLHPGSYYMAYVRDEPYNLSSLFPRTQLMLAYSADGITWREVLLLDRLPYVAVPTSYDLYQFLDPCVRVTASYIHVGYGKSFGAYGSYHNAQRAHYIRVRRPDLSAAGVRPLAEREFRARRIG